MNKKFAALIVVALGLVGGCAAERNTHISSPATRVHPPVQASQVSIITTAVPFPRGLALEGDTLFVLSRGRVRDLGGTDVKVDDKAGTIWAVDTKIAVPMGEGYGTESNAKSIAPPTAPPFKLLDRTKPTALDDHETDRPYCGLRYDPKTKQFFVCAFSGIDKPLNAEGDYFRKNPADAILSFNQTSNTWFELWRGAPLDGADNCLVAGDKVYVVTKENSKLLEFRTGKAKSPREVAGKLFDVRGVGVQEYLGHSMLAARDGYLYVGFRTSSTIIRIRFSDLGPSQKPIRAQLVATFDPFDAVSKKTPDLTDMSFGPDGDLYVVSAKPARVYRFHPDPENVFDARNGKSPAWADLSVLTNNTKMKSENLLVDDKGHVYVTSADRLGSHTVPGVSGVVYRISPQ